MKNSDRNIQFQPNFILFIALNSFIKKMTLICFKKLFCAKNIERLLILLLITITSFSRLKHFISKFSMTSFLGIIAVISQLCHQLCPVDSVIQLVREGHSNSTDCSQRTEMKIVSIN